MSGPKKVRLECKPAESLKLGVPYENAMVISRTQFIEWLTSELHSGTEPIILQMARRSQIEASDSLRTFTNTCGPKTVRLSPTVIRKRPATNEQSIAQL